MNRLIRVRYFLHQVHGIAVVDLEVAQIAQLVLGPPSTPVALTISTPSPSCIPTSINPLQTPSHTAASVRNPYPPGSVESTSFESLHDPNPQRVPTQAHGNCFRHLEASLWSALAKGKEKAIARKHTHTHTHTHTHEHTHARIFIHQNTLTHTSRKGPPKIEPSQPASRTCVSHRVLSRGILPVTHEGRRAHGLSISSISALC